MRISDIFGERADTMLLARGGSRVSAALLVWFDENARALPWRTETDPYLILLSEVLLQQTRVEQALPYYLRFVEKYPRVGDLARAHLDDILHLWEGLGYYARARNLHAAARQIVNRFDGSVPSSYDALLSLPGVGRYTASAVLSIAFNQPRAVLDGNVIRVLARLIELEDDVSLGSTRTLLWQLADDLLSVDRPGVHNEAMMELGATVCTPGSPTCPDCPLIAFCKSGSNGSSSLYPFRKPRNSVPHYDVAVGVLSNDRGELLLQRRPENGLLGGLWEFPGGKRETGESMEETCRRELREELGVEVQIERALPIVKHAYSHFKISMYAFECSLISGTPRSAASQPLSWVTLDRIHEYAIPRANRKLIAHLRELITI